MRVWLPTRYLAAWLDVNKRDCNSFLSTAITNTTHLTEICTNYPFDNLQKLQYFALAPYDAAMKT